MKIELNPNKMTIDELTDVINELTSQRERLKKEKRQQIQETLTLQLTNVLNNIRSNEYKCYLKYQSKNGMPYSLCLTDYNEWHVELKPIPIK